jgi:hypothetical protein
LQSRRSETQDKRIAIRISLQGNKLGKTVKNKIRLSWFQNWLLRTSGPMEPAHAVSQAKSLRNSGSVKLHHRRPKGPAEEKSGRGGTTIRRLFLRQPGSLNILAVPIHGKPS